MLQASRNLGQIKKETLGVLIFVLINFSDQLLLGINRWESFTVCPAKCPEYTHTYKLSSGNSLNLRTLQDMYH